MKINLTNVSQLCSFLQVSIPWRESNPRPSAQKQKCTTIYHGCQPIRGRETRPKYYKISIYHIAEVFESQTGRPVSIGSVHSTLDRLSNKGFLTSEMGPPSTNRGGRRKRIYTITASGQLALKYSKEFKVSLWEQYPALSFDRLYFS